MTHILNRGNKLFEGSRMMLPEHVALIREYYQKQTEYAPPLLAEDQLEEFNHLINQAVHQHRLIQITYVTSSQLCQFVGHIKKIDPQQKTIQLYSATELIQVPFIHLVSASLEI